MRTAYISLGSNMGERSENLRRGVACIVRDDAFRLSSVYETEPVGGVVQDDFLNLVVELETAQSPRELLFRCREAEDLCGRTREIHWGPRTLDADVLLVGELTSDDPEITIPHPRMNERRFVLVPLRELAPQLVSDDLLAGATGAVRAVGTLSSLR